MKRTIKKPLALLLSVIMIIAAIPFTASAVDYHTDAQFKVRNEGNTFTISRINATYDQTISYRTVSKTALAGVHFTETTGTLTFTSGQHEKTVTVPETPVSDVSVANRYQNGNDTRFYEFEVMNEIGQVLAYCRRTLSDYTSNLDTANRVHNGSFNSLVRLADCSLDINSEPQAYDDNSNSHTTIRSYIRDITALSDAITVKDKGFGYLNPINVSTEEFITYAGVPKEYLAVSGAEIYLKPFIHMRENDDGYQYIQILTDNPTNFDTSVDDGNVGNPNYCTYICGFEHGDSYDSTWSYYSFPYDADINSNGANETYDNIHYNFVQQKVNSNYGRIDSLANALAVPVSVSQLNFRFDASGNSGDDWQLDLLKVRGLVVDKNGPSIVRAYAAPGNYRNGQLISVSVEFNEAVFSAPAELVTNFGTLHTEGIYRNNVVVYSGQINGTVGSSLSITGFNYGSTGSVQDMFGSSSTPAFPSNSFSNVKIVTRETPQQSGGSYNITNINELMSFIDIANQNPNANGVLMNDIDINPDGRYNIMLPQIGTNSGGYMGTFTGQGQMSLTNLSLGDELFKTIGTSGTVKNITFSYVYRALDFGTNGMLCNENNGTIEHCEITGSANDRAINVSQNYTGLGLLVGTNNGTITDCRISGNYSFNKGGNVGHLTNIGGIAAENYGNILNCLFVGDFSLPASYTGYMGTVCVYNRSGGNVTNSFGKYTSENDFNVVYSNSGGTITNSEKVSTTQLASGEVTWNLNNGVTDGTQTWYQSINSYFTPEPYPAFSRSTVYKHGNIYTNSNRHILSHVDGIQEDCVNSGCAEYWYCTIDGCGKIFSDSAAHNETTLSDLEIPALGHDWSTEWNQNHEGHRHVCTRCGAIKDEAAHACSVPQYTWSTDNLTVDAYKYCDVCNRLIDSETVNTTAAPDTATCTDTGYIRYTANFTKDGFATQIKDIATPALGHDVSTDWSFDNTYHWHSCTRCSEIFDNQQHSFGQPVWTWSKYFNASAKLTCSVCGEEISYDAVVTRSYSEMTTFGEQTLTLTATVTVLGNTYTVEKSYQMLRLSVNSLDLVEGQYQDFYFIPGEDAAYRFYSVGNFSVDARLFDEDDNQIAYGAWNGNYINFDMLRDLEAGKMYRLQLHSDNLTGYLGVHVTKPVTYPITYDNTVQHGNLRVQDLSGYEITRAYEGMLLHVGLSSDSGYRPESVTITNTGGDTVSTHGSFRMPASGITVSATFTDTPIQLGENNVYVEFGTEHEYSFTPSQSGEYRFYSTGDFDMVMRVKAGYYNQIGASGSGHGYNFDTTVSLEAGTTYTLGFWPYYRYNNGFDTDFMTMYVERIYSQYDINEDGTEGIDDIAYIISASQGDISMTPAQTARADIDGDGVVDGFDAAELDRILFGYTNPKGDVNQDGIVNSLDYAMLKSYVLCDNVDLLNKNYLDSEYDSIKDNYGNRVIITQNYYCADFNGDKSVDAFDVYYLDSRIYTIV